MIQEQAITGPITRIITERGKEMLRNSSIPESLWPEAIKYSVWLKNRSPAKALKNKKTPFEAIENLQPSLAREKIWGSRAYVIIPLETRRGDTKLHSPRGWLGYFVGCESELIYRIWDLEKKRVLRISAARIDDGEGLDDSQTGQSLSD